MKRNKWIAIFGKIAFFLMTFVIIWQLGFEHHKVVKAIDKLTPADVEKVLVYESDSPRGAFRVVEEAGRIKELVASLKSGKRYSPNHDRSNGFQRAVILEPQNLQFQVYQRDDEDNAVIVGLGEWNKDGFFRYQSFGYIRCQNPSAWKQL